mgnify:CR=1 FL=1
MTDDTVVQPGGQPSTVEPVPLSTDTAVSVEPPKAPSADEILNQKIAEAVAKAVTAETERARREIQSTKDKARAEVESAQRRAKLHEDTLGAVRSRLQTADPEVAKELELAELRAKDQARGTFEQEEAQRQAQDAFLSDFYAAQTQFVESLGIDPKDKRIDWAGDASSPLEALKRIQTSVAGIQKETIQTLRGLEKRLQDFDKQQKTANIEANSVTTAAPAGAAGSDAEFMKRFASGEIPLTAVNVKRCNEILAQH